MSPNDRTVCDLELAEEALSPSGLLLTVSGELDLATVPALRERLRTAIEAGADRVVLDLRPLAFMDSVAMAALLHARRSMGDAGRMAVAVAPESYTRLIFEIAGVPQCLAVFATREEAVAHVAG